MSSMRFPLEGWQKILFSLLVGLSLSIACAFHSHANCHDEEDEDDPEPEPPAPDCYPDCPCDVIPQIMENPFTALSSRWMMARSAEGMNRRGSNLDLSAAASSFAPRATADKSAKAEPFDREIREGFKTLNLNREAVMETWRSSVAADAQRKAVVAGSSAADSTDEKQTYAFMLAALDDPEAQLEMCRKMERGNSMMKKQAVERLALLMQNPNLKEQLVAAVSRDGSLHVSR